MSSFNAPSKDWETRTNSLWMDFAEYSAADFLQAVEAIASELPAQHPVALFERGCASDSTGRSDLAAPLYREALDIGLTGLRRRRASIQLASSLRNIGALAESVRLLESELTQEPDELDAAVKGFLALALSDQGRKEEALAHSLQALSSYLPRYNQSMHRYATMLIDTNE